MKIKAASIPGSWFVIELVDTEGRRYRLWESDDHLIDSIDHTKVTALAPDGTWTPLSPTDSRSVIRAHRALMEGTDQ